MAIRMVEPENTTTPQPSYAPEQVVLGLSGESLMLTQTWSPEAGYRA